MKPLKHWQDPVNALLGAWLVVSPWAIGYVDAPAPRRNAVLVGIALIAAALGAIFVPKAWEEWVEGALALWLIVSPWALGFAGMPLVMLTAVLTGTAIVALAIWTLVTDHDYTGWMHHTPEH